MPNLIDVETDLVMLLDRIMELHESGAEVPDEALAALDGYVIAAADKRDACAAFLAFVQRQEDACADRIDELIKRQKAIKLQRERFEEYVLRVMQSHGIKSALGNESKFVVATSSSVDPGDFSLIPDEYMRVKPAPAPEPDKVAIKTALKLGRTVGEAKMVAKTHLSVKMLSATDRPGTTLMEQ